jgi:DNA-directed RNA polymerase specialized sigma24 family protein
MQEHVSVGPPLWISGTDENGKLVSREVIQAAHRIWTRVLQHLRYNGHDIAPAAEILESACHSVSRAIRRKRCGNPIRSLESYLFWAFVRKYNRQMMREGRIRYVESVEAFADRASERDNSWVAALEDDIQFKQLLGLLDAKTRLILMRRISGDSWAEIGKSLDISAHNAEVQFANGIKKAKGRLLGQGADSMGRGNR